MAINDFSLSVVVPIYNEVDNIEPLLKEIEQAIQPLKQAEIIYVDDGSSDGSVAKLHSLQSAHPLLKVVEHAKNYGQSASIVSGARAASYPWIATLDGDGQNNPADIIQLIKQLLDSKQKETKPLIVVGNRAKRDDSWVKRISSKVGNGVRQRLLKDECPDTGCSLKLFPKEYFLRLPHFNHLHRFIPALFQRAGFKVMNVPVSHRPRTQGVSKYGISNRLWAGILDLFGMIWLIKRPCSPEIKHEQS